MIWEVSIFVAVTTLAFSVVKRSWILMLISSIAFSPLAYYFFGANTALKYVGFFPVVLLVATIFFWFAKEPKAS